LGMEKGRERVKERPDFENTVRNSQKNKADRTLRTHLRQYFAS